MKRSVLWTSLFVAVTVVGRANAEAATEADAVTPEDPATTPAEAAQPAAPAPAASGSAASPAKSVEAGAPAAAPKTEAPRVQEPATTPKPTPEKPKTAKNDPTPTSAPAAQRYALPPPADARPPTHAEPKGPIHSRFVVGVGLDYARHHEAGFDLFSSNDVESGVGAFLGYAIIDGFISVVPEFGFSTGSESRSDLFGGALGKSELDTRTIYGDVSFRLDALSFLEPEARVAAGASTLKVSVQPQGSSPALETSDTAPFLSVGGGLTLRTPAGALETRTGGLRTVAFGLTAEGGYVTGKSLDITPSPSHETGRVATTDAHLGTLERSGPYVRIVAALRF